MTTVEATTVDGLKGHRRRGRVLTLLPLLLAAAACAPPYAGGGGTGGLPASGGRNTATGGTGENGTGGTTSSGTGGGRAGTTGSGGVSGRGGAPNTGGSGGDAATGGTSGAGPGGSAGTGGSAATGGGTGSGGSGQAGGRGSAGSNGGMGGATGSAGAGGHAGRTVVDPGDDGDGDFNVGPSYQTQPDLTDRGNPKGRSFQFGMPFSNSSIYTGTDSTLNRPATLSNPRNISVYVPAQYKDGTAAPVMIMQDGPPFSSATYGLLRNALDNLTISQDTARRIPPFIVIGIQNGGGDSKGSERGLEYDTMSDRYARFVQTEVLPAVLAHSAIKTAYPNLKFTEDSEGRAAIGCSSGAAAALTMAWFRNDLFHRVISYSGTFVDQQDDDAAEEATYPYGAWEYHGNKELIANSPKKDLRIFLNVNESDLDSTLPESSHHNWVIANQHLAADLKAKGYHYRYVFGRGTGHCDSRVQSATLADALIWLWRGYHPS